MRKIVIYGAGGHGKVIADIVEKSHGTILAFVDDDESRWNKSLLGYPIWGGMDYLLQSRDRETFAVIIGIGDNHIRERIQQILARKNFHFGTAIHPSAQLGKEVTVGEGTVVMANGIINSAARVGRHCIVNTAAIVGHDCIVGDFVHVSAGAILGGAVRVDDYCWIGMGASIINNIHVEKNAVVGAGAVVINNIDAYTVNAGVPAKLLRKINKRG